MDLDIGWDIRLDRIKEPAEFDRAMPRLILGDHLAARHLGRREERRRAMAQVIMGVPLWLAGAQGQERRRALSDLVRCNPARVESLRCRHAWTGAVPR